MATSAVKFGYVKESNINEKIASGALDEYDYVFTHDTKRLFVINPDLSTTEIHGSIYTYKSEAEAVEAINKDTSTYSGQIISVESDDKYKAYIVNKSPSGDWELEGLGGGENYDFATPEDIKDLFK